MKLQGKIGLVTGGASGIGRATCIIASREGAHVVVGDIDDARGAETVNMVKKNGGSAEFAHMDVTNESMVREVVSGIISKHGRIDFLHNNAGGWHLDLSDNETMPLDRWSHFLTLNLTSVFIVTKYVVEQMKKKQQGSIINMSSINGFFPNIGTLAYSSAKAGVIGFTKELALEVARHKIRVNVICPGEILTPMWRNTFDRLPDPTKAIATITNNIPLGRVGDPEDVAKTVVWLASDDSSYITGTVHVVDGGRTIGPPPDEGCWPS